MFMAAASSHFIAYLSFYLWAGVSLTFEPYKFPRSGTTTNFRVSTSNLYRGDDILNYLPPSTFCILHETDAKLVPPESYYFPWLEAL